MAVTSDEVNYLIYRYMQESGFAHSSFAFGHESHILKNDFKNVKVSPGALINLLQKGLLYTEAEMHVLEDGTEKRCTKPFSLLQVHECNVKSTTGNGGNKKSSQAGGGASSNKREEGRRKEDRKKMRRSANNNTTATPNTTTTAETVMQAEDTDKMEVDVVDVGVADGPNSNNTAPPSPQTRRPTPSKSSREIPSADIHTLHGHTAEVFVCQWNPARPDVLATGSGDATARIWNTAGSGGGRADTVLQHSTAADGPVKDITAVSWNSDGTLLATGSYSGQGVVWGVDGGMRHELGKHAGPLFAIRWNKSNSHLVSVGGDRSAIVWDAATGEQQQKFTCHKAPVLDVDWRDNNIFATCSTDKSIAICRLGDESALHRLTGHTDEINTVRWDPDGTLLASCSDDQTAKIWSTDQSPDKCLLDLTEHSQQIYTLAWNPASAGGSRMLATASFDRTVKLWDIPSGGRCLQTLGRHSESVYAVSFTPDGKYIASGSFDGRVNVWSVSDGALVKTHKIGAGVFEVCWNSSGRRLAVCSSGPGVVAMDIRF